MASLPRRSTALLLVLAAGIVVSYVQGSALFNVVGLLQDSPVTGLAAEGYAILQSAIDMYGIWAYIGASLLKGLLLFYIVPAEAVTPLYVLSTAETPVHVAGIAVVGAAAITVANTAVYVLARLAGGLFKTDRDSATWRFVEWIVVEHGRTSMYLLRIVPWIGGWVAIPAGIARLNVRTFIVYSFLGFLTYETILGYAAYYGLKSGTASVSAVLPLLG